MRLALGRPGLNSGRRYAMSANPMPRGTPTAGPGGLSRSVRYPDMVRGAWPRHASQIGHRQLCCEGSGRGRDHTHTAASGEIVRIQNRAGYYV